METGTLKTDIDIDALPERLHAAPPAPQPELWRRPRADYQVVIRWQPGMILPNVQDCGTFALLLRAGGSFDRIQPGTLIGQFAYSPVGKIPVPRINPDGHWYEVTMGYSPIPKDVPDLPRALREAAEHPESCDVPGLLRDAAAEIECHL